MERLVNQFLDERGVGCARKVLDGFALTEEREGLGSYDPVAFGGERALDDVELYEFDFAFVLLGVLDEIRLHLLAVDAGGAVEHHEHGQLRKFYFLLPTAIVHFQQVHGCTIHAMLVYTVWNIKEQERVFAPNTKLWLREVCPIAPILMINDD